MKFFAPALIFCGAVAFGQSPQVPHKMQFAGMTLAIRDDARRDIQKDVDALTQHPKYFNIKVERAKTYFPIIEKIFEEERLPLDFKYLSLQESALVPDAVSSSNAVGFWQFKDFTAQEMGLRVDTEVDERMNIASASRGAARYLKQCNHYFNNWVYALQAYQMGAGGVMRAVGDTDLGVRHMEITPETYWYVRKFIAHKVAFEAVTGGKPAIEVAPLTSAGGKSLTEIAMETSSEEQKIREFNKWLKSERIPTDKEYVVLIPKGEASADFAVLATAANSAKGLEMAPSSAEVKLEINGVPALRASKGEGIASIARRGNVSVSAFLHYNEMEIDKPLQAGQPYFLHKKKKRAAEELYTVKAGENLWLVSQKFGVQQKFLRKFNSLGDERTLVGMTLYLNNRKPAGNGISDSTAVATLDEDEPFSWDQPMSRQPDRGIFAEGSHTVEDKGSAPMLLGSRDQRTPGTPENPAAASIHEVQSTDTLYSVARQYGVTIKELMEWNDKKDFSLSVGEKLKVNSH